MYYLYVWIVVDGVQRGGLYGTYTDSDSAKEKADSLNTYWRIIQNGKTIAENC